MEKLILIKYGELTTKKGNRGFFIRTLKQNIKNSLKGLNYNITSLYDRMYIETDDIDGVVNKIKDVFGLYKFMIVFKTETNEESINQTVLEVLNGKEFETFKVETKRSYKDYPITSMEVSKKVGGLVLKHFNTKVDVHNPALKVNIEIYEDYTFIYTNEIKGKGGYPTGVLGKGLLMLSGGIDSPVAGYLALKRGIDLECIYFDSPPHTSLNALNKVKMLADKLNNYSGNIKLIVVPFTKLQEAIYKNVKEEYNITIMRRMMYRISERIAKNRNLKILINGENIGQVASQTLDSLLVINNVVKTPVLRPVSCMDKEEIIKISKEIGTYETSILPYEDCCTIFVPKHPVIHPKLEKAEKEEQFEFEKLIEEAVNNIEIVYDFELTDNSLL